MSNKLNLSGMLDFSELDLTAPDKVVEKILAELPENTQNIISGSLSEYSGHVTSYKTARTSLAEILGEVATETHVDIQDSLSSLLRHPRIHLHQSCHAVALGFDAAPEAIGLHDGLVVGLVGAAQLHGHGDFIVEVGQGAIGVERTGIQDGLGGVLNGGLLGVGGRGPGEVVVDDGWRILITHLKPPRNHTHPRHMNI